jgi:hypothetical protein
MGNITAATARPPLSRDAGYGIRTCSFRENGGKPLYRNAVEGLMLLIRKKN